MPVSSRLRRPLAAVVLGAALLAPVAPAVTASATPSTAHTSAAKPAARATHVTLAAYGDADDSGAVHLSGALRWTNGKGLGHKQHVELWSRTGQRWTLVRKAVTDRHGDVELSVTPTAHTTYQLRYAGSHSRRLSSPAAASVSRNLKVRAVARVALATPARAHRGQRFVVSGTVTPAGAGRVVTLAGDGRTYTTLTTRTDGSFTGHVRLQMSTTLSVVLPDTATLDGAVSGPHVVRVA